MATMPSRDSQGLDDAALAARAAYYRKDIPFIQRGGRRLVSVAEGLAAQVATRRAPRRIKRLRTDCLISRRLKKMTLDMQAWHHSSGCSVPTAFLMER
jgi:hypothetical protein